MGNSIIYISKPAVIANDLPHTKPADFLSGFCYEIAKPIDAQLASLVIDLSFNIYSDSTLSSVYEFATHSYCEIETRHTLSENYMLLYKAIKITIDNYRDMFLQLNLDGYTDDVSALLPYPKYDIVLPVLKEIFNPFEGLAAN